MANPLEPVEYATIVGRFMVASTDSDDLGDEPDIIAATGKGRFLPSVSHILVAGATPPATIKLAPVDFEFDEQGYISNPITKERGVRVVAPTDAVNPTGFTYRVTFDAGTSFLGFDFSVPAGGTVDLTRVGRVAQNGGVPITRGEPGVGVAAIVLADDETSLQITYDNGLVRVVPVPALDEARVARDEAVEAATNAVAPTQAAIAQALVDPDSEARGVLNATYGTLAEQQEHAEQLPYLAPLGANIQTTVRKLHDPVGDVRILVLGDSTADWPTQFADPLMVALQGIYPHRTLFQRKWDTVAKEYPAETQVGPTGTGAGRIDYFNGAVSGTVPESLFANWERQVAAVQPDLVLIHFGHNYGRNAAAGGAASDAQHDMFFRESMIRLVGEVKRSCPRADVMVNSQNPITQAGARPGISSVRAQIIREISGALGCGYGPVVEAYLDAGDLAPLLNADGLHPSPAGAQLTVQSLLPLFRYQQNVPVAAKIASPFETIGQNLLPNGDFADFTAPPALSGWTATNAVLSKDTTNYESSNGYSVRATVGTGSANLYASIPSRVARGNLVTFAARMFIPASAGSSVGRVTLAGDGTVVTGSSGYQDNFRDRWTWVFATTRVPVEAGYITALINLGSTTGQYVLVDRAIAVLGGMPRELARPTPPNILRTESAGARTGQTPIPRPVVASPDGSRWEIRVDNAGAITSYKLA